MINLCCSRNLICAFRIILINKNIKNSLQTLDFFLTSHYVVRVGISRSNVCASILCHVFYQLIYYTGRNPRDRRWEISCGFLI